MAVRQSATNSVALSCRLAMACAACTTPISCGSMSSLHLRCSGLEGGVRAKIEAAVESALQPMLVEHPEADHWRLPRTTYIENTQAAA
ncbi:hypothetical protein D3C76_1213130 [compost metagenome]